MTQNGRDVPLIASSTATRQTIGEFARAVGLSASALRQYGETGLLEPDEIEARTGYRYYAPEQQQRAIWIRRLRDAGLGLSRVRTILDGEIGEAEDHLDSWLAEAEERRASTAELVSDLKLSLRARVETNPVRRTTVRFDGSALAAAIAQVATVSAADAEGLPGVLIESDERGASVIATDRYVLVGRSGVAKETSGPQARVSFTAEPAITWLRTRRWVELVVDAPAGRDGSTRMLAEFHDDEGGVLPLTLTPDLFPSTRELLANDAGVTARVVFRTEDVLRLSHEGAGAVTLRTGDDDVRLGSGSGSVEGSSRGARVDLELSAAMLTRIAEAAVGPLLSCDIRGPGRALIWRAPSQPDFVALVMPRGT